MNSYTLEETEYKEKNPVINDIVNSYFEELGIDISKYYFSEYNPFKIEDVEFHTVIYSHVDNEDVSLLLSFSFDGEKTQLAQFDLSLD